MKSYMSQKIWLPNGCWKLSGRRTNLHERQGYGSTGLDRRMRSRGKNWDVLAAYKIEKKMYRRRTRKNLDAPPQLLDLIEDEGEEFLTFHLDGFGFFLTLTYTTKFMCNKQTQTWNIRFLSLWDPFRERREAESCPLKMETEKKKKKREELKTLE